MAGRCIVGLSEHALSGVLRVLTHSGVFHPPTPGDAALTVLDAVLAQTGTGTPRAGGSHRIMFCDLAGKLRLTGNRLPDAYYAALAMEHGCEWVTLDRGFSIFPGLRVRNLLDD